MILRSVHATIFWELHFVDDSDQVDWEMVLPYDTKIYVVGRGTKVRQTYHNSCFVDKKVR